MAKKSRKRTRKYSKPRLRSPFDQLIANYRAPLLIQRREPVSVLPTMVAPIKQPLAAPMPQEKAKSSVKNPLKTQPSKYIAPLDVCSQRKARTEIMHATNKAGKSGQKKPHYTEMSKIKCT